MTVDKNLDLSHRFVRLPLAQRRLFFQKLLSKNLTLAQLPIPVTRQRTDRLPLSYAQQRQWFLWRLEPESSAYHVPALLHLRGELDQQALERSFANLVARHEILRSTFHSDDEGVFQRVHTASPVKINRLDVADGRLDSALAEAERDIHRSFDLECGPLLRVSLLRLAADDHVLVMTLHHIVADGWSMPVIVDEIGQRYTQEVTGSGTPLPDLPIQYSDYALWQSYCLEAGEGERQLAYWRNRLGGARPPLELSDDGPRPAVQSHRGARVEISLAHDLARGLRELAQRRGVTLFTLLLASFQCLLHRRSGQADIRVGIPIANRTRRETERLVGFFVNTQILQARFEPHTTFDELLQQVQQAALEAQAHQDLPFEHLVDALQPERSLSHSPLFQVLYNHQVEVRGRIRELAQLRMEPLEAETRTAQFDLTLDTFESAEGLRAALTYATDLFAPAAVERLAQQWRQMLTAIQADPGRLVSELPLLGERERQQILYDWNALAAAGGEACIHELFERQAACTPEALALIVGEQEYRYRELNQAANRLAHRLRERGVGPDRLVGVALERRLDLLVGLLAILKAGGGYVPLDPAYPAERQAYMLSDSGARLLLTQSSLLDGLPDQKQLDVMVIDRLGLDDCPDTNPASGATPGSLAFSIYTSGSTGKPKGVLIEHRSVSALIHWSRSVYSAADLQGVLAATSICFDLSVWEFFVTLSCGGFVVLADNALELPNLAASQCVRLVNTVPSAIGILSRLGQIPESVAVINLAGEPLAQELVEELYQLGHVQRVHDLYGPSEDTTYSTHTLRLPQGTANIGRPLAGTAVYLLDATGEPVGVGSRGELCLAGAGLARGYLNRPALTAERFLPNPFDRAGGGRMYRTGDLARYQADGLIQYLGRLDHQVKIRGFRIELGEIVARLRGQPGVRDAVVLAREGAGGQQLVGYVVPVEPLPTADQAVWQQTLRLALQAGLPDYMVPAQLLLLDSLPLTPNGKLDRNALPTPRLDEERAGYLAPTTDLERRLAALWQEVLKVPQLGVTDNFFEVGGDSILSLQVVSRARQAGLHFTPKDLFRHQTIQALARIARHAAAPTIDQGLVTGAFSLAPVQHWFFERPIPARHHWNQSVVLAPSSPLSVTSLEGAVLALLEHHDALRASFTHQADGWQATLPALATAKPLWFTQLTADLEWERLAEEAQRSLSLETGALVRVVLGEWPDGRQRLLLVIHHLVVDGVSWRILLEDLQLAYAQLQRGQRVTLPAKSSSFQAWSERLCELAHSEALAAELSYWCETLAGASDPLPAANPGGSHLHRHVAHASTRLDREWTRRLLQEAPSAYRTQVNDLLLTALARVLCRWTGRDEVLVRLEGHGREELFDDLDLTRTVGWFTSLYPVRLAPRPETAASIKAIKEQLRAVPGKGVGYGLLRYLGSAEARRALRELPAGAVVFNYLGQFDQSFAAADGLFVPAQETGGAGEAEDAPLDGLLNLNGRVYDGEFSLDWTFSAEVFAPAAIHRLATDYEDELKALIAHCADNSGATPADFPLVALDQQDIDQLPLPAAAIADLLPLAPLQQGMLFHTLYEREAGDYVNQLRLDVEGLDVEVFRQAWQAVLDRHEVLRATFLSELKQPVQLIHRRRELPFQVADWRSPENSTAALDNWAEEDRRQGFDLASDCLIRLAVFRTGERRHHLVLTHHHILLDGWSTSRLLGEVLQHYAGQAPTEPAGRYRDYLAWLQQRDPAATERFWRERLRAIDEPTRLIQTLPVAASTASGQGQFPCRLDMNLTQRLVDLARRQRVTVNTLIQSAWAVLLYRYTGQTTVCFGATMAGRPADLPGVETQLGLFINTLPVLVTLHPEQEIRTLLHEVQTLNLLLREHEYTPLHQVQRWAGLGGAALFDSLVVFENYPVAEALQQASPGGLSFGAIRNHEQTNYPLTLAVNLADTLDLHFSYSRSLVAEAAVSALARHFLHLLESLIADPEACLGSLSLVAGAERVALLKQWDQTAEQSACRGFVHEWVAEWARLTPTAPAVIFADQALSYGELDRRANQLARHLVERGVGPEAKVAIAMPRSADIMVAFLAVLKAGGAYVPLDIAYPPERLAYMLEDCQATLVLSQTDLIGQLPLASGMLCLAVDQPQAWQDYPNQPPAVDLCADNLAYVIYTSGSTGQPKGVSVAHGPLASHIRATGERYETTASDCELHFMSFAFDGAHEGWMHPLINGARVLIRDDELWPPERTYAQMQRHEVTLAVFPPVYLQQLAEHAQTEGSPPPVRVYCFGGDAVPQASYELAWRALRPQYLFNGYGPTETVVTPLLWKAARSDDCGAAYAPIGTLLGKRRGYVLDGDLNLLPVNMAGELYLGGEGVARGYLARPALTAERFVPDPFGEGERLYRSGDLTRARPDGVMDYLGRIDLQVKIRGFRIELGEIEARLRELPEVREAVVIALDGAGGKQLVGYAVPLERMATTARQAWLQGLRDALRARLPDYMVPAHLQVLDALPLTPNGKLDRKALPLPRLDDERPYVAPETLLERQLVALWQDVLQVPRLGVTDNFFEVGGDSILSLQLVSRARQVGIQMTPKAVFEQQTIQALARVAEAAEAFVIDQGPVTGDLDLSPIQHWFFAQDIPERQHWNQSVVLEADRPIWKAAVLEQALRGLLIHHDALRLTFREGGARFQSVAELDAAHAQSGGCLAVATLADVGELETVGEAVQRSLDLARGVLLRAVLAELTDGSQRLVLVIHHLVVDGVSWRILLEDLELAYRQLAAGKPLRLPAKTSSLQEWSRQLLAFAGSEAIARELDYWQRQLEGAQVDLPGANLDGDKTLNSAVSVHSRLDVETTRQLLHLAPAAYRTHINDLLLTALSRVICRWTGTRQALIQLEGHGREDLSGRLDLSRTLGWFTSIYPLALTPEAQLGRSIMAIKEQLRAVPNRGLGFGMLRYLGDQRSREALAALPEPRITFNYLGQFTGGEVGNTATAYRFSTDRAGADQAVSAPLGNSLSINGQVYAGVLNFAWTFSREVFARAAIEDLAQAFQEELQLLVEHCCRSGAGGLTPSDVPLAGLSQQQLDDLGLDPSQVEDIYPLTPMQYQMVTSETGQDGDFICQHILKVRNLVPERLQRAWQLTLDAHSVLRTGFTATEPPLQVVQRGVVAPFARVDGRAWSTSELAAHLLADRCLGFDLATPPLMRLLIIQVAERDYQVVLTSHHVLLDGWSAARLYEDLMQAYLQDQLPPRPTGFRDYIAWLQQRDAVADRRFWREQLDRLGAGGRLAEALQPDERQLASGHGHRFLALEASTSQALDNFARQQRVTVNTLFQAAWTLVLGQTLQRSTVGYGVTLAGRPAELPAVERQLGLYINDVPLVVDILPELSIGDWLQGLQVANLQLREHGYTFSADTFATEQEAFDTVIVFENYPGELSSPECDRDGVEFLAMEHHEQTCTPLTLYVERDEVWTCHFDFRQDLFLAADVDRLCLELQRALDGFLLGSAARSVGELRSRGERGR
ncbi:non-ribosomal peptide synthetase [Pseudomonas oryzihabitans]|uniref:non-ribosomal peptide synthetase n=1 Tax=Pseudomonas oryzihabitans TaxID=47885 RepID=UPI00119E2735|nr:non-ribosomal peptide synthetase [Pseudomonas psychrotolerans]